jgi:hypothetical protein
MLFVLCIAVAALLVTGAPAVAQGKESREISDRWKIQLATVFTDTTTDVAAGDVLGALIRVEDVLDYDKDETVFGISGFFRFKNNQKGKQRIWFSFSQVSRDSSGILTLEVPIFDETFTGAFASEYDTSVLQLQYRLSLLKTDRGEAGIIAGLSAFDYGFKLAGEIDDGVGGTIQTAEAADFLAPIPTFGFFLSYAVRHNLIFNTAISSLEIEIGDIEGRVFSSSADLTWFFTKNFGASIGFAGSNITVTDSGEPAFKVDYRLSAATIGLTGVF